MSDLYLNRNKKIKLNQDMQHDGRRIIHAGLALRVLTQLYSDELGLPLVGLADLDPYVWKRGNGQVKSSQLQKTIDVTYGYPACIRQDVDYLCSRNFNLHILCQRVALTIIME